MDYRVEWMPVAAALGLVTLLFVPVLGFLVALAILAGSVVGLVALVAAALASPFLLVRSLRRRWSARGTSEQVPHPAYGDSTTGRGLTAASQAPIN
jgi:hypothetical protein